MIYTKKELVDLFGVSPDQISLTPDLFQIFNKHDVPVFQVRHVYFYIDAVELSEASIELIRKNLAL